MTQHNTDCLFALHCRLHTAKNLQKEEEYLIFLAIKGFTHGLRGPKYILGEEKRRLETQFGCMLKETKYISVC